MPQTHRIGDCNDAGGCVTSTPNGTVYADNILIAVNGAIGTSHAPCPAPSPPHCAGNWTTANGGPTVFAENIPINKTGDADTCGHTRAAGSPDVFNDAFVGGGPMYDNSAPFNADPPEGAQPSPPAGFGPVTEAIFYVIEEQDELFQVGNPPPPNVDYEPLEETEAEPEEGTQNVPPTQDCSSVNSLPSNFNWVDTGATSFQAWAQSFALSPNFTVWDMCNGAVSRYSFSSSVTQASGLSQKQILINMCHHAKIVLEPMLAAYGPFWITSGFRNKSGSSQHNKGQATDIQFSSLHGGSRATVRSAYYERAKEVRDNQNYDQFILEYFARNPWFHLSSNPSNHRGKVNTQISAKPNSYATGLRLLG